MKLLNLRQNFSALKIPISTICSKPNFVSEIGPVLYLQDLKNSLALEDRLTENEFRTKFRKKRYQLQIIRKRC